MPISFSPWGLVPDSPALRNRLKSAADAKMTPLELDAENKTARFSGDHGIYETRLDACQCVDFGIQRRKGNILPCKHILRLAMELRLIDVPYKTDPSKIKEPIRKTDYDPLPAAVAALESTPGCLEMMSRAILLHSKGDRLPATAKDDPAVSFLLDNELLRTEPDGKIDIGPNVRNCYSPLRCYLDYRLTHKNNWMYVDTPADLLRSVPYEGVAELLVQYDPYFKE